MKKYIRLSLAAFFLISSMANAMDIADSGVSTSTPSKAVFTLSAGTNLSADAQPIERLIDGLSLVLPEDQTPEAVARAVMNLSRGFSKENTEKNSTVVTYDKSRLTVMLTIENKVASYYYTVKFLTYEQWLANQDTSHLRRK